MKDITAVGEILIDMTQTGLSEAGVPLFAANPGGAPANVAVAASRLGASTAFIGKTGRDPFGAYLRRVLEDDFVDCSGMHTGDQPTTMAIVSVDSTGERSFSFVRGADCELSPDEINESAVCRSKFLHFGSVSLTRVIARGGTIFAARAAHLAGVLVSYDPNYRPALWRSEAEAAQLLRQSAEILRHSIGTGDGKLARDEASETGDPLLAVQHLIFVLCGFDKVQQAQRILAQERLNHRHVLFPVGVDIVALVLRLDHQFTRQAEKPLALIFVVNEALANICHSPFGMQSVNANLKL